MRLGRTTRAHATRTQSSPVSSPVPSSASAVAKWKKAAHDAGQAAIAVKRFDEVAREQKTLTAKEVEEVTARLLSTQKLAADETWRKERAVSYTHLTLPTICSV